MLLRYEKGDGLLGKVGLAGIEELEMREWEEAQVCEGEDSDSEESESGEEGSGSRGEAKGAGAARAHASEVQEHPHTPMHDVARRHDRRAVRSVVAARSIYGAECGLFRFDSMSGARRAVRFVS